MFRYLLFNLLLFGFVQANAQYFSRYGPSLPLSVDISGAPAPGYIFLSPRSLSLQDDYASSLMLLDSAGALIWYAPVTKDSVAPYGNTQMYDFKIHPNGLMSFFMPKPNRNFLILNEEFEIIDSLACTEKYRTDEHDLIFDEDGNYFLICDTAVFRDASHLLNRDSLPGSPNCQVFYQMITEFDTSHQVVRKWHSLDRIGLENVDPNLWNAVAWMDHTHVNSLLLDGDDLVISSRNTSEITRFDRYTGDINWRLGGPANEFTPVNGFDMFSAQHDANYAANGNLYFYDNGSEGGGAAVARYVELSMDTASREATMEREIRIPGNYQSRAMGNAILTDEGHVIVSWAYVNTGHPIPDITEFNARDQEVMNITFPLNYLSYRVQKARLPFVLKRPLLTCSGSNILEAPAGYAEYHWNTGDTGRTIVVQDTGIYQVYVDQGIGFIASPEAHVTNLNAICAAVGQPESVGPLMSVFPNPTDNLVSIKIPVIGSGTWNMRVLDPFGREIWSGQGKGPVQQQIGVGTWGRGLYLIEWVQDNKFVRRKLVIK